MKVVALLHPGLYDQSFDSVEDFLKWCKENDYEPYQTLHAQKIKEV